MSSVDPSTDSTGTTIDRIVVVPRWGGTPGDDWYPHLVANVAGDVPVEFSALLPSPAEPRIAESVAALADVMAASPPGSTLLVGHSVGCQVVLRWIATLSPPVTVGSVLLVAGWWTVDEPWPTIQPYLETPIDTATARAAAPDLRVLLSDDDPFTADVRTAAERFRGELGAHVELAPGDKHFNRSVEPAVDAMLHAAIVGASR